MESESDSSLDEEWSFSSDEDSGVHHNVILNDKEHIRNRLLATKRKSRGESNPKKPV